MPPAREVDRVVELQDRDLKILQGLFESRIMTTEHIAQIYFAGRREAAKKRLQKIKAAGFLAERVRRVNEPAVVFLTRKALRTLSDEGRLSSYPSFGPGSGERRVHVSDLTLRHELEVLDVKSAFYAGIGKSTQFHIAEFSTWPALYQFQAFRPGRNGAQVLVKPDGLIRIHEREYDGGLSEHTFFLEVDRSTETQATLVERAGCYLNYYRSGDFAERNGGERMDYKEYPFRVLIVLKTTERRNNTAERLLLSNPPILTQVYLSTFEDIILHPLEQVWIRPVDYREVTAGSSFEPTGQRRLGEYRRQVRREAFIESNIQRHFLL